jgi:CSLREA domain-containing protein
MKSTNRKTKVNRRVQLMLVMLAATMGVTGGGWRVDAMGAATTRIVTKTADTNDGACNADCSLREAIAAAVSGDTIQFSSLFDSPQTITVAGDPLAILSKNLTIQGPGPHLLTVSGNNLVTVFVTSSAFIDRVVSLSGMTIANGQGASGGGISNLSFALTITNCRISGNSAVRGGGIYNFAGALTIIDSTVSGNSAGDDGGGVFHLASFDPFSIDTLTITNSTFSDNSASDSGGGVFSATGFIGAGALNVTNSTFSGNSAANGGAIFNTVDTVAVTNSTLSGNSAGAGGGLRHNFGVAAKIRNSIIAGNTATTDVGTDVYGTFSSQGYNLIGTNESSTGFTVGSPNQNRDIVGTSASPIDPKLGPLADNGGPTETMEVLCGPAIDKGSAATDPATGNPVITDQRGQVRPIDNPAIPTAAGGDDSDIGAFEAPASLVCNTRPTIAGATIERQRGAVGTVSTIATVSDADDEPDSLTVEITSIPAGITITGLAGTGGTMTANVAASCSATLGANTVGLEVTDSGGLTAEGTLTVNVTSVCNTMPTIAGSTIARQQGAAGTVSTIAAVGDAEDEAASLSVQITSIPAGITVTGLAGAGGTIAAKLAASCGATLGANTVGLKVTDSGGLMAEANLTVNVTSSASPVILLKPSISLWPPNHSYRAITMSEMVLSATDDCDGNLGGAVVIEKVTSDEPDNVSGESDGETLNDIVIAADLRSVMLRAERDQNKNGRVYSVVLQVLDTSGNVTKAVFKVSVPLNQSGAPAVDIGVAQPATSSSPAEVAPRLRNPMR